jgi:prolyl-tRNA synthetase
MPKSNEQLEQEIITLRKRNDDLSKKYENLSIKFREIERIVKGLNTYLPGERRVKVPNLW